MNSENQNYEQRRSDEITLKELIFKIRMGGRYLLSKWLVILFFCIIGGMVGFAYTWFKKPIYTATTTFVLEEGGGGGGLGQYSGLASMVGIDIGGSSNGLFSGDNILELYKSRKMLKKALLTSSNIKGSDKLLVDQFIDFNRLREKWDDVPNARDINFNDSTKFTVLQDSLLSEIITEINKEYLVVSKPDKKSSIINVQLRGKDEAFAKAFADQIVSTVNNFYVETKTKRSIENVNILQHQKDSVQAVMNGAIFASAATLDATPNLNPTRQTLRAPIQKSQFNAETNKAILGELVKNLELSKISLRKETPLIQVIDEPVFPLIKDQTSKIKGTILGFVAFGFLTVLFLSFKLFFKKYISG